MDPIDRAASMLDKLWLSEIVPLRVSRAVWDQIREPLAGYQQANRVRAWYQDSILAGCRRLLDRDRDSVSLVRALELLRDNASELTAGRVVAVRAVHGHATVESELEREAQAEFKSLAREHGDTYSLDPGVVEQDLDRLEALGREIKRMATRSVAHRDRRPVPTRITEDDVDSLLDTAASVHARWYGMVLGAYPDMRIDHLSGVQDLVTALEVFDWDEYVQAEKDAQYGTGLTASSEVYERVSQQGHVHYCFDSHTSR